jgi:hypothetical protein
MADTDTNDSPFVVGPTEEVVKPTPKKKDNPFVVGPTDPTPESTDGVKYYFSGKRTL